MEDYLHISAPEVLFLSDTHFMNQNFPGEIDRRNRFFSFLNRAAPGTTVFFLGDIFNFYFEYHSSVPKRYSDIFNVLYDCSRRGVQMHFLGGNHDCWTGDYFQNDLGIVVHEETIRIACQERKIICVHGDLMIPGDIGYKMLRRVVRNRFVIAGARRLHPDFLYAVAGAVSNVSKSLRQSSSHEKMARSLGAKPQRFFLGGNDVFVMGHVHYPLHIQEEGKDFLILGDWINHFTFGKLSEGRLTLETFTG